MALDDHAHIWQTIDRLTTIATGLITSKNPEYITIEKYTRIYRPDSADIKRKQTSLFKTFYTIKHSDYDYTIRFSLDPVFYKDKVKLMITIQDGKQISINTENGITFRCDRLPEQYGMGMWNMFCENDPGCFYIQSYSDEDIRLGWNKDSSSILFLKIR